jgi:hypothetical protein
MRIRSEYLDHDEVVCRIGELFNLADQSYSRLSKIQHAYRLIRPAPKVNKPTPWLQKVLPTTVE